MTPGATAELAALLGEVDPDRAVVKNLWPQQSGRPIPEGICAWLFSPAPSPLPLFFTP